MLSINSVSNKLNLKVLLVFSILLTSSSIIHAEIYKWTDDNGNTHYSDIKPNNADSQKLKIKTSNSTSSKKPAQETAKDIDKQKQLELKAKADILDESTRKRELEAQCEAMRNNLKTLEEKSRIKVNEDDQVRFLTAEEIESKKQNFRQKLKDNCQN